MVEPAAHNSLVVGSIPTPTTIYIRPGDGVETYRPAKPRSLRGASSNLAQVLYKYSNN